MERSIRRVRLRTRVTLLFVLVGLATSVLLSTVSFLVARNYLLDRRDDVVERQAFNNAEYVRARLMTRRSEAFELINGSRTEQGGFAVLHLGEENLYYSQDLRYTQNAFPAELRDGNELRWADARERSGARRFYRSETPLERSHASLGWTWQGGGALDLRTMLRGYRSTLSATSARTNGVAPLRPNELDDRVLEGQLSLT